MGTALNGGIGIVANPASARDIRRLVAAGSVVTTHTKVNMLARVLSGVGSVGVHWVLSMTDLGGISAALEDLAGRSGGAGATCAHRSIRRPDDYANRCRHRGGG